ncbi:MAG: hypothetical protein ACLT0Y_09640, partial [Christensenellales bacterium]
MLFKEYCTHKIKKNDLRLQVVFTLTFFAFVAGAVSGIIIHLPTGSGAELRRLFANRALMRLLMAAEEFFFILCKTIGRCAVRRALFFGNGPAHRPLLPGFLFLR